MSKEHYKQLNEKKLSDLKGQLEYVENALKSDLEEWERKEFLQSQKQYQNDIQNQEKHIEYLKQKKLI